MDELFFKTTDHCCGKLRGHDQLVTLVTKLGVLEGIILEKLEEREIITLQELMETLQYNPCVITMAVGSLIREGVLRSREHGQDIFLERHVMEYSNN